MLTNLFESAARIQALREGPAGTLLETFAQALVRDRYAAITACRHLRAAEHFPGGRCPPRSAPCNVWSREAISASAVHPLTGSDSSARPGGVSFRIPDASARHVQHALRIARVHRVACAEAIHLRLDDITPDGLVIRCSKFRKSRLVPLHETARAGLERYLLRRRPYAPTEPHVFVSLRRKPLLLHDVEVAFRTAARAVGLPDSPRARPSKR